MTGISKIYKLTIIKDGHRNEYLLAFNEAAQAKHQETPIRRKDINSHYVLSSYVKYYGAELQNDGDAYGAILPAVQEFSLATGRLTRVQYFEQGMITDPVPGEPADQYFDAKSGVLNGASSFLNGEWQRHLTEPEIVSIVEAKKSRAFPGGLRPAPVYYPCV